PEVEAPHVAVGNQAEIKVQSLQGRRFAGQVARSSWALDPGNRTLRTEIDVENDDGSLRPGMFVSVRLVLAEVEDALVLPTSAIGYGQEQPYCCVVESGRISRRPIQLGLRSGSSVQILSGL